MSEKIDIPATEPAAPAGVPFSGAASPAHKPQSVGGVATGTSKLCYVNQRRPTI